MKAIILCGGQGTRIREVSVAGPKPMLPIGDRPILWHIMKGFATHDVNNFVLCLGYKGWMIKEYFINYRAMTSDMTVRLGYHGAIQFHGEQSDQPEEDWSVTLAETGEQSMTGYRLWSIRRYVERDDLFLATYGDGVSDVDVTALVDFHRKHGRVATVTGVRPPSRYGELEVDSTRVLRFSEKPQTGQGMINGGFFVLDSKRIWNYLSDDPKLIFEQDPLAALARDGQLMAYEHPGFWQAMDTPREYSLLNDMWLTGKAPWKTWKP